MGGIEQSIIEFGRSFVTGGGFLGWVLRNWVAIALLLVIAGVALDWAVWLLRFPQSRRSEALLRRLTGRETERRRPRALRGASGDPGKPTIQPHDPDEPKTRVLRGEPPKLTPLRGGQTSRPPDRRPLPSAAQRPAARPGGGTLSRGDRPDFLRRPAQRPMERAQHDDDKGADE